MSQDFDVRSRLTLESMGAERAAARVASRVEQLNQRVHVAQMGFSQLASRALAFGGAYLGVNAVTGAFRGLVRSATTYTAELEATKIGVTSVVAAVEKAPWEVAAQRAEGAFERIKQAAIESPGTAQQMFGIFTEILGPIEAAGFGMDRVHKITQASMLAAAALGVDFGQAARDVNLMVTGAAGADVKFFRLLRATGAITESTEEWNKALSVEQRVEKLSAALGQYEQAGVRFGKSWAGVTSTFQDIRNEMKREAFTPVLAAVGKHLDGFNQVMIAHRGQLAKQLGNAGRGVARIIDTIASRIDFEKVVGFMGRAANRFGHIASAVGSFIGRTIDNWDKISARIEQSLPILKAFGLAFLASKLGGFAPHVIPQAAAAMGFGGGGAGGKGGGDGLLHAIRGLTFTGSIQNKIDERLDARLGRGGATLAKMTMAPAMGGIIPVAASYFMGGAGEEKGASALAAQGTDSLTGSIAKYGVQVVGTAGMALAAADHWDAFMAAMGPSLDLLGTAAKDFGGKLWDAVGPIIKIIGSGNLVVLQGLFTGLGGALSMVTTALGPVLDGIGALANSIYTALGPAIDYLLNKIGEGASKMAELQRDFIIQTSPDRIQFSEDYYHRDRDYELPDWMKFLAPESQEPASVPKERKPPPTTNVDARGARVMIKQEFSETDPDRILAVMYDDIEKQAESRLASAFRGALTD